MRHYVARHIKIPSGIWGHEQEVAFERIKEAVVKALVLKYFNERDPTECQGDASQG